MKIGLRIYAAVCFVTFFASTAESQNTANSFFKSVDVTGYISLGANWSDLGDLNSRLDIHNYPVFSDLTGSFGGGTRIVIGEKFIFGIDFCRLFKKSESSDSYNTTLSGSINSFNLGYIVYKQPDMAVYPIFGIGMQNMEMTIYNNSPAAFESLLETPEKGVELSRRSLLMDIAVQIDRYSQDRERKTYKWGIKAGYRMDLWGRDWVLEGSSLEGGPDTSVEGLYIQFNFGLRDLIRELFR